MQLYLMRGGGGADHWESLGNAKKRESSDLRFPEVGISGLCKHSHCCSSLHNKYFSSITSIYLLFSLLF